jgi:hypothetical protein
MLAYALYIGAALYLGILTSISPCPLATNIAAVSYIGRKVENARAVIRLKFLYLHIRIHSIFAAPNVVECPGPDRIGPEYGRGISLRSGLAGRGNSRQSTVRGEVRHQSDTFLSQIPFAIPLLPSGPTTSGSNARAKQSKGKRLWELRSLLVQL